MPNLVTSPISLETRSRANLLTFPVFDCRMRWEDVFRVAGKSADDLLTIIAFGSFVKSPKWVEESYLLFWKHEVIVLPNDLDLMMIVTKVPSKSTLDEQIAREGEYYADYGSHWRGISNGRLHLTFQTPDGFFRLYKAGDSVAVSVVRDGVLLMGSSLVIPALYHKDAVWDVPNCKCEPTTREVKNHSKIPHLASSAPPTILRNRKW